MDNETINVVNADRNVTQYGSYVITRKDGLFSVTYMCQNFYAIRNKNSNVFTIYQTNGNQYGTFTRGAYKLDKNHMIFENGINNDFFLIANSKYGALKNIKCSPTYVKEIDDDEYGIDCNYEHRVTVCKSRIHNSNLFIMYPKHNMMPTREFMRAYSKVGIVNGLRFSANNTRDMNAILESCDGDCHAVLRGVMQNVCESRKNFAFSHGMDSNPFTVVGLKFDKDSFYIEYNDSTFTYFHAFLVFLSHCF